MEGELPSWLYQTLVELAVPALYACCTKFYQCTKERQVVKHTRECCRKAAARDDSIAGLRQLLVQTPSSHPKGQPRPPPLCFVRGSVTAGPEAEPERGEGSVFPFWGTNTKHRSVGEPVIRLSTKEICWKHISVRNVGQRVSYEIEKWNVDASPFRVVDSEGNHVCIPQIQFPDLNRKIDLRLLCAEKEALPQSLGQQVYQALCRGRYAAHLEKKEQALLSGSTVTVLGQLVKDEHSGDVSLLPEKGSSFFITEKLPEEILQELDDKLSSSFLKLVGLAATSAFFAGVLGLYLYVVGRDLIRSLRGHGGNRDRDRGGRQRQRNNRPKREVMEDVESSSEEEEEEEEEEGNGKEKEKGKGKGKEAMMCCICLSRKNRYALVPCGHCCTCKVCAISLFAEADEKGKEPRCPICRTEIDSFIKVYK